MDIDATINRLIHLGRVLEAARHDPNGWEARYGEDAYPVEFLWTDSMVEVKADIYTVSEMPMPVEFVHDGQIMIVTPASASFGHLAVRYRMAIGMTFSSVV